MIILNSLRAVIDNTRLVSSTRRRNRLSTQEAVIHVCDRERSPCCQVPLPPSLPRMTTRAVSERSPMPRLRPPLLLTAEDRQKRTGSRLPPATHSFAPVQDGASLWSVPVPVWSKEKSSALKKVKARNVETLTVSNDRSIVSFRSSKNGRTMISYTKTHAFEYGKRHLEHRGRRKEE